MAKSKLYHFTPGDEVIFKKAEQTNDPSWILNYYMRSEDSGTWWRHVDDSLVRKLMLKESKEVARKWRSGYKKLFRLWESFGKPDFFGPHPETNIWDKCDANDYAVRSLALQRIYRTLWHETEYPVFHHPHGIQLLDWQLELHRTRTPLTVNVGGFGCVAGETILDGTDKTVAEFAETNGQPFVQAWTGKRFVEVRASVPWVKGKTSLYRVTMESGRKIVVTQKHRFLTSDGWQPLSACCCGLSILSSSGWDKITEIEFEHDDVFYDLHVPVYENYLAQGLVNHNSAKTWGKVLSMLVRAVTLVGYRGFFLAPYSNQAEEAFKQALLMIQGTKFEQFLIRSPTRPRPTLVFGHDRIGTTSIECYSVLDDPDKILTLSGDEVMVDQAERIPDLDGLIRSAGTRLRGQINGRPRVGQISLLANSAENPNLWDLVDEGIEDPDYIWTYNPSTFENIHLTISDLFRFEKQVGRDETTRMQFLKGERPIGDGEHFSKATLEKNRAAWLDEEMTKHLEKETKGWVRKERVGVHVYRWESPYDSERVYLVAADPGWSNPPGRNSPAMCVWDITDFPLRPATLAAFYWVSGNNSPNPWIAQYMRYTLDYHAIANNGFDGTGIQSGYERLTEIETLSPIVVNFAGARKYTALNFTKKIMADGLLQMPSINHIFSQCANYRLPDAKLRQDLVMMLVVSGALLEEYYYVDEDEDISQEELDLYLYNSEDRYWRDGGQRYSERSQR